MTKIELDIECKACGGTGIYVGLAERNGAAVVCYTCGGTGKQKYVFEYTPFTSQQFAADVKRVYASGMGYVITPDKLDFENIGEIDMSQEGVSYAEFREGCMPFHVEDLGCPMLADQCACHKIEGFTEQCPMGRLLTSCEQYSDKAKCWERFHAGDKTNA